MALPERKEIYVRLPADVTAWVRDQSARTTASQNATIVMALRAQMDSERQKAVR